MQYIVIEDRQGGSFGMDRAYTVDEWLEQARAWCEADDNTDLDNYLENIQNHREEWTDEQILGLIDETWNITLKEGAECEECGACSTKQMLDSTDWHCPECKHKIGD